MIGCCWEEEGDDDDRDAVTEIGINSMIVRKHPAMVVGFRRILDDIILYS